MSRLQGPTEELHGSLLGERTARREAERALDSERERAAAEVTLLQHEIDRGAHVYRAELTAVEARLAAREAELETRREELEQARAQDTDRAEREVAIEALVGELVETTHGLRAGFQRELEALSAGRDEAMSREREHFSAKLTDVERRVDELTLAAGRLREELAQERNARRVAEAELTQQRGARALAANPFYDVPPAGPQRVSADHPALARLAPPTSAPAVVGDLARAMDRLREGDGDAQPSAPPAPARTPAVAAAETDWFPARLAAFARTDGAAAERLLLASLAVQAATAAKDVTYELELPGSGRHRVVVARGNGVSVAPVYPGWPQEVEFRLVGPVSALAALAGGSAPRRLSGVSVRGRRRRLRRLLRALSAPVGLARLRTAHANPAAADLLAMLCDGVPAEVFTGADFAVAYDIADGPGGVRSRTVVRAWPDGRLGLDGGTTETPDAVITLDGPDLLGLLDGSLAVTVEGDRDAADTLHQWLRGVQGL